MDLGQRATAELARTAPDARVRAGELQERLRWFQFEAGHLEAAAAALNEALQLLPAEPPSAGRARAVAHAAGLHLMAGEIAAAGPLAEEALQTARASGAVSEEALSLGILGTVRALAGDVEAGIATYREGLAIAEGLGGIEGIALGYANLAVLLDRLGQEAASLAAATEGLEIARRRGVSRTYGAALAASAAHALFELGRWDEAATMIQEAVAADPVGPGAAGLHAVAAGLATNRGDLETAADHIRAGRTEALAWRRSRGELIGLALAEAELAAAEGRVPALRAAIDTALTGTAGAAAGAADPATLRMVWHELRAEANAAELARARGDADAVAAVDARAAGLEVALRGVAVALARDPAAAATLALIRGERSRIRGSDDPAAWGAAAAAWRALARPAPVAYARYREAAAILAARGSRDEARRALAESAAIAEALGAAPLARDIRVLATHARLDLTEAAEGGRRAPAAETASPADDPGRALGLTPREVEVIRLLAEGRSNQEIADAIFVSRKTASVHVSNILAKLDVRNRVEAAALAHRLGLAGEPPAASDVRRASAPSARG